MARLQFGYHPPAGDRGTERVDPATFLHDLDRVLALAAPAFESVWISDHFMTNDRYRLECWTLLTWVASRHTELSIAPIVAAQSYRHPPLFAKMLASLDALMVSAARAEGVTPGRAMLGYGAGWTEEEYLAYGYDFPPLATRIEQLDEALEAATRVLRANSLAADRVYAVYNRSLADLIAGRRTAAAGSFSVLQAAQAELG